MGKILQIIAKWSTRQLARRRFGPAWCPRRDHERGGGGRNGRPPFRPPPPPCELQFEGFRPPKKGPNPQNCSPEGTKNCSSESPWEKFEGRKPKFLAEFVVYLRKQMSFQIKTRTRRKTRVSAPKKTSQGAPKNKTAAKSATAWAS